MTNSLDYDALFAEMISRLFPAVSGVLVILPANSSWGRAGPPLQQTKGTTVNLRSPLVVGLVALGGVALIVIAIVYWAEPASSLPSFFPGHQAGSSHHHIKHGIASFFVGLAALVFAWFQTGKKNTA